MFLGLLFTTFQIFEYQHTKFSINSSAYGSIFFVATGFHGLHVIIGTILLIGCFFRELFYNFNVDSHFGFEAAA